MPDQRCSSHGRMGQGFKISSQCQGRNTNLESRHTTVVAEARWQWFIGREAWPEEKYGGGNSYAVKLVSDQAPRLTRHVVLGCVFVLKATMVRNMLWFTSGPFLLKNEPDEMILGPWSPSRNNEEIIARSNWILSGLIDARMVEIAKENAHKAGVSSDIAQAQMRVQKIFTQIETNEVIISSPPYGEQHPDDEGVTEIVYWNGARICLSSLWVNLCPNSDEKVLRSKFK